LLGIRYEKIIIKNYLITADLGWSRWVGWSWTTAVENDNDVGGDTCKHSDA
jgi:hypothetical protein